MAPSSQSSDTGDSKSDKLPDYTEELAAFHREFAIELQAAVENIPLDDPRQIVDIGCGDGFYTDLLARRFSRAERVVGMDKKPAFLELARQNVGESSCRSASAPIEFQLGDLDELAEQGGVYDLVWCAQSLFSFPEPLDALRAMLTALRPGGLVAVLENDTLHQLFLPWPSEVELILRTAELDALADESDHPQKFYIGRRLPAVLVEAGFEPLGFATQCVDRAAPLSPDLQTFLRSYLDKLWERVEEYLSAEDRQTCEPYLRDGGKHDLLRQPQFTMSCMNVCAWGRRPA